MLKSDSLLLTVGVLGILALGSVSGVFLKVFVAKRQPHPVFDNVISRVRSWWVMAALVGLALLAGRSGVCMLFAFASFVALRELMGEAEGSRGDRAIRLGGYFLALPVQYLLILVGDDRFLAILVPAYAFLGVPIIAMLAGDASDLPRRAAPLQWGLMLCVLALSYAPALLTLEIPGYAGRNSFLLVFLLLVTQLGDVLQYLWGKLAGSRPLAPGVSPSKTVEGTVGGVVCATGVGTALAWVTPFTGLQAALISLAIAVLGVLGGLTLSAIKRDRGIKDWGTLIAGHGGMLDRVDSLCFSAPLFYYYVRLGWA